MILLHGDIPYTHAQSLAQCLLAKGPYKMIGSKTVDWILDEIEKGDWLSFSSLPKGTVLWDDLESLLKEMGLGYAVSLDQDFHGNGDDETLVLCMHDPKLGDARFLYGIGMTTKTGAKEAQRPNGRLLLSVDAITPESLAHAQMWQAWLDGMHTRVARSAHATLDMMATQT